MHLKPGTLSEAAVAIVMPSILGPPRFNLAHPGHRLDNLVVSIDAWSQI